jgi:gluconolactonase
MPAYVRPTKSMMPPYNPLLAPQPALAPLTPPAHVVDLMSDDGSAVFGAVWRGREAKIIEVPALSDSRPEFKTTYDVDPHAEVVGFDDSDWELVPPTDLNGRRGGGLLSFFWFRTTLTIPSEAAGFATANTKAVLRINIDDYAEIWVNGELPRAAGRPSPACIQGFNMPHRLVLGGELVQPGDKFEVAVFAINGPLSAGPANFLWFREAKVEFYK